MNKTTHPAKILLIEDGPADQNLIQRFLPESKLNNTIEVASNGAQALDYLFQRNGYTDTDIPDLVLLDLNLPKVDGQEVLERMKEEPDLQEIPVVVLGELRP